jgi:hypothetical protein
LDLVALANVLPLPGQLRLLCELEQRGTFGAVATALGYSPSAISQQLTVGVG